MAFNKRDDAQCDDSSNRIGILQDSLTTNLQIDQNPLEFTFNRSIEDQERDEELNLLMGGEEPTLTAMQTTTTPPPQHQPVILGDDSSQSIAEQVLLQQSRNKKRGGAPKATVTNRGENTVNQNHQVIVDADDELFNNSTEYFCMLNEQLMLLKRKEKKNLKKLKETQKRKLHHQQIDRVGLGGVVGGGSSKLGIDRCSHQERRKRRSSMEVGELKKQTAQDSPAAVKLEEQHSSDQRTMTLNQFSSIDTSEKSDSSFPKHCRICYAGEFIQGSEPPSHNESNNSTSSDHNLSGRSEHQHHEPTSAVQNPGENNNEVTNNNHQNYNSNKQMDKPLIKKEKLLQQICKCKGSMKFVHESCLIKWLQTQSLNLQDRDKRKCELCLSEYKITYEFDTMANIIRKGFNYAIKDKKRLIRGLLYILYLYIFFKRFTHMIKSLMKFMVRMMLYGYRGVRNLVNRKGTQMIKVSKKTADQSMTNLLVPNLKQTFGQSFADPPIARCNGSSKAPICRSPEQIVRANLMIQSKFFKLLSISGMVTTFIRVIGFLYRLFIFNQMCILFYGEAIRLKKYMHFLIANSKKMTFKQYKDNEANSQNEQSQACN